MKDNVNPLLILGFLVALAAAVFLFFDRPTIETIKVVTTVDTTYVLRTDTLYVEAEGGGDFQGPEAPDTIVVEAGGDTLSTYRVAFEDSLVSIQLRVTVKGVLTDWGVRYNLHIPVVVSDTTIIVERNTETVKSIKQWSLNLGASALLRYDPLSPYFAVGPSVTIVLKNHRTISYAFLSDGSHMVTLTTPLVTR